MKTIFLVIVSSVETEIFATDPSGILDFLWHSDPNAQHGIREREKREVGWV